MFETLRLIIIERHFNEKSCIKLDHFFISWTWKSRILSTFVINTKPIDILWLMSINHKKKSRQADKYKYLANSYTESRFQLIKIKCLKNATTPSRLIHRKIYLRNIPSLSIDGWQVITSYVTMYTKNLMTTTLQRVRIFKWSFFSAINISYYHTRGFWWQNLKICSKKIWCI